jgi:sugar O-acyltransferase (sialic acid O-acetyltransferase NeuD family)
MKKSEIILIGGGGHCKSCIDVIEAENEYKIKGIIDLPNELGKQTLGYKVIGNDEDLTKLAKQGFNFLITLGHMGNVTRRKELFEIIKGNGGILPSIQSPRSNISKHAKIGKGTIIMHHAIVNADAKIGDNCIINSKALIEHDVRIGNDCHISTDANINGNCVIADNCFIGSGSSIKNGLEIAEGSLVGVGSVVVQSIFINGLYFGNPAKKIKNL